MNFFSKMRNDPDCIGLVLGQPAFLHVSLILCKITDKRDEEKSS